MNLHTSLLFTILTKNQERVQAFESKKGKSLKCVQTNKLSVGTETNNPFGKLHYL